MQYIWTQECIFYCNSLKIKPHSFPLFHAGGMWPTQPPLLDMMLMGRGRLWEGSGKLWHWLVLTYLLLLALPCGGFLPDFWSRVLTLSWDSHTHQYMTEQAILNITMETLNATRKQQGNQAEEQVSWCGQWGYNWSQHWCDLVDEYYLPEQIMLILSMW